MALPDHLLARATAETVARASYGKLVAYLASRSGDVAGAEDALSDAFAAALTASRTRGVAFIAAVVSCVPALSSA